MWNINHKKLTLAFCLSFLGLNASAQVGDSRNDFAIGVSGGINLASVDFTPSIKQGSLFGKNVGITLRYTCEKYITAVCALQVECNYATQGWKEVEDESATYFAKTMDYVQVPFLAKLGWGRERKGMQGYILLGPQLGFLLSERQEQSGEWVTERTHTYQHSHNADNKFDYGITLAAGAEFSSKIGHIQLEARYYYGLHDFYDNSNKGYFGRSGNNAITLKASYLIDLFRTKNPTIK